MPLSVLFGKRSERIAERLRAFASEFEVEIHPPARIPNTERALAVTEFARDEGVLEAFRDLCMDAHWQHALDIEADDVLADLAARVGLDSHAALSAADDPGYRRRVSQMRELAFEHHVTGIPTFLFGAMPVVGCQRYETLELVADKLGVPRRPAGA